MSDGLDRTKLPMPDPPFSGSAGRTIGDSVPVVIAAYLIPDLAQQDFDGLVKLVGDKQLTVEGVALVTNDADGNVSIKETGDHLGRKGLAIGGGVGLVVGLFAPPLLASVIVGGAAGALIGKFARHRVESGLEDKMGAALPPGSAGIVAIYDRAKASTVDATLASAVKKSVAHVDGGGAKKLKAALADAQAWAADRHWDQPDQLPPMGSSLEPTRRAPPTDPAAKPSVLFVYYTYTQQTRKVVRGDGRACSAAAAATWPWPRSSSPTPATRTVQPVPHATAVPEVVAMIPAEPRRRPAKIGIPAVVTERDYDLVCIGSPTWWLSTDVPIRSFLESDTASQVLHGKPFAAAVRMPPVLAAQPQDRPPPRHQERWCFRRRHPLPLPRRPGPLAAVAD